LSTDLLIRPTTTDAAATGWTTPTIETVPGDILALGTGGSEAPGNGGGGNGGGTPG
jgi:hypothetical protein